MRFGCFGDMETIQAIQEAGFDYVELPVRLVKPESQADEFEPFMEFLQSYEIVPEVWSHLLEDDMPVYGPEVDSYRIERYLRSALSRLEELGAQVVVFNEEPVELPEDFSKDEAVQQLSEFIADAATIAGQHGITLAVAASRIPGALLANVDDLQALISSLDHPFAQLLAQRESCPPATSNEYIVHAWGDYDMDDQESEPRLAAFLSLLTEGGYDKRLTIGCPEDSFGDQCREALSFLKTQARKLRQQTQQDRD